MSAKLTGRCAVCGERIQRNGEGVPWRHQRPQPSGKPHDHAPTLIKIAIARDAETVCAPAIVDRESMTVTFAVTFKIEEPWAMDACDAASLAGVVRRVIQSMYYERGNLISVETWEPREEKHIVSRPAVDT